MTDKADDKATEEILDELDGVLPGEVDRRKFLNGAVGLMGASMLAGCVGGDGNQETETTTSGDGNQETETTETTDTDFSDVEATFTTPWKIEANWGFAHVAQDNGYWEDAGVPGVEGVLGNGSDTETNNIGIGNQDMGMSSLTTAISVMGGSDEPLDLTMVAMGRGQPNLSLVWRTDEMDGPEDLEGKDVLLASGFAQATWDLVPQLTGVEPASTEAAGEELGPINLARNEYQAVWGALDLLPAYEAEADVELGAVGLTNWGDFYGFPIWVNSSWYEGLDNRVEFTSQMLEGYFEACRWGLVNREEFLDYLVEKNADLQTWTREELRAQHSAVCAQMVTAEMQEEGLGHFTADAVDFHLEQAAPALTDNPDAIPRSDELVDREPWEESEKVVFSDDEWETLKSYANEQGLWDLLGLP